MNRRNFLKHMSALPLVAGMGTLPVWSGVSESPLRKKKRWLVVCIASMERIQPVE